MPGKERINQFVVVTGMMRSGTSAVMRVLDWAGARIVGFKFPIIIQDREGKPLDAGTYRARVQTMNEDNPTGFWEVAGVTRNGLTTTSGIENFDGNVVKVMIPSALCASSNDLVGKVILVIRDPKKSCASMIKNWDSKGMHYDLRTVPILWTYSHLQSMHWLGENLTPFQIVIYEELLENPVRIIEGMSRFLEDFTGKLDPVKGAEAIERNLNRSQGKAVEGEDWKYAYEFYEKCKARDMDWLRDQKPIDYKKKVEEIYQTLIKENNLAQG